jgi:hypothetical protein
MSLVYHDGQGLRMGTFLSCGARLSYHLTVGPILQEWPPHLEALPYTSCANSMEQYCSRVWGEGGSSPFIM